MKRIVMLLLGVALVGCASKRNVVIPENDYFSGEFVYFADAANFTDCATGVRYPVSHTKAYQRIERSYLMLTPTPAQPLYVEFRGRIVEEPSMEESAGNVATIVIDSLIGFHKNEACDDNMLLAGVYESTNDDVCEIIRLKPNYTYEAESFADNGVVKQVAGIWKRSAMLELLLIPDSGEPVAYEIIPPQQSFADNSGGTPKVFTRVYL